jgi:TIGR02453 family protein
MSFNGFNDETRHFLVELKLNNSKPWYEANRERYTEYVLKPFQELVGALSGVMLDIDPLFEVTPKVDKTISRIYRDTRFSKDKSLYRDNVWITFKRPKKEWTDFPAFFFELFPGWYRYGMGYYSATRDSMDTFRKMIDEKPQNFLKAIAFFKKQEIYSIEGDRYKRDIVTKAPEINEWYNRKNLFVVHNDKEIKNAFSSALVDELASGFQMLKPLYEYLCDVEDRTRRERG